MGKTAFPGYVCLTMNGLPGSLHDFIQCMTIAGIVQPPAKLPNSDSLVFQIGVLSRSESLRGMQIIDGHSMASLTCGGIETGIRQVSWAWVHRTRAILTWHRLQT